MNTLRLRVYSNPPPLPAPTGAAVVAMGNEATMAT